VDAKAQFQQIDTAQKNLVNAINALNIGATLTLFASMRATMAWRSPYRAANIADLVPVLAGVEGRARIDPQIIG